MRVAFLATLKPPDHPTPSGDRQMARLLVQALGEAGADVRLASRFSSRTRSADPTTLTDMRQRALAEAEALITGYTSQPGWRPDIWLTYHLYYKAPDWIGSAVSKALAIPYVVAEASYAGKRDRDAWAPWQAEALGQLRQADRILCFSQADRAGVAPWVEETRLIDFPPFLDTRPFARATVEDRRPSGPLRLITVAMMRGGAKLDSYRHLAGALERLAGQDWRLEIIGDGPARAMVTDLFAALPVDRVIWRGLADPSSVRAALAASDLFVWPGLGEAFGMVYLEAAAAGLPSIAYANGGVASVIDDGKTGILVDAGDMDAYAAAIRSLIDDADRRRSLATGARRMAFDERSLARASERLDTIFTSLTPGTA